MQALVKFMYQYDCENHVAGFFIEPNPITELVAVSYMDFVDQSIMI